MDHDRPNLRMIAPGEGVCCKAEGGSVCLKLTGHDTHGRLSLIEYLLPPNRERGTQIHSEEDQTLYVLEGEIDLHTGQETLRIGAGGVVFVPRHVSHGFQAAGNRPCRLLLAITPAGLEHYYRECERLSAHNPADWNDIADLSAEYGIRLVRGAEKSPAPLPAGETER